MSPDHPLAPIDVNDPCSLARHVADYEGIRVVKHRGIWAAKLPVMGWVRAPGPSLRGYLQARIVAHTNTHAHEAVLRTLEAVLCSRAYAWADVEERERAGYRRTEYVGVGGAVGAAEGQHIEASCPSSEPTKYRRFPDLGAVGTADHDMTLVRAHAGAKAITRSGAPADPPRPSARPIAKDANSDEVPK